MSVQVQTPPLDEFGQSYLQAWHRHDPDEIVALHTPDSVFRSVAAGKEAVGREQIREALVETFLAWPDLMFRPLRIYATPEVVVAESLAEATQAIPLSVGDAVIEPNGRAVTFVIADILALEGGLVKRKDSYVDMVGYVREMRAAEGR